MGSPTKTSDLDQGKYDVDPDGRFAEAEKEHNKKRQEARQGANSNGETGSEKPQGDSPGEASESAEATTSGEPQREEAPEDAESQQEGGQPTSSDESSGDPDSEQEATGEGPDQPEGEDADPDAEATTSEEDEATDEEGTSEEAEELDKPFHYNGLTEEAAEDFDGDPDDFVFISGVDGGQTAYQTVEDMVEGFERLQQHRQRIQRENKDYRERISDIKSSAEGELEELRAQINTYKNAYGGDVVDVLAQAEMPEEYRKPDGEVMSREDFEDPDELGNFIAEQRLAKERAQKRVEEMEGEAEDAAEEAKKRQKALEDARDKAVKYVDKIREDPEKHFDLPQDDIDVLLPEVFEEMTDVVEDEDGEEQRITPLFRAQRLKALGHDREADLIVTLIGERMKRLKAEKSDKIKSRVKKQRKYRKTKPKASETPAEPAEREIGDPEKSFAASQNARNKRGRR